MARYYQAPNNPIVDLTPKIPIDYYAKLMEESQNNLNQANVAGAGFMTDLYGQKVYDKATADEYISKGQAPITQALEKDFVTPASMAKAVTQASQIVAPWKNLNAQQVEQVKRQQETQDKWGSNWIGNDVAKMSLRDPNTGQLISADSIKMKAGNRKDLVEALERDYEKEMAKVHTEPIGMHTVEGGKYMRYGSKTTRGLTPERWQNEFVNNKEKIDLYMQQMPGLREAIEASGQDPREYFAKEIANISKQWIGEPAVDYNYIQNQDYNTGLSYLGTPLNMSEYNRPPVEQEGKGKSIESLKSFVKNGYVATNDDAGPLYGLSGQATRVGRFINEQIGGDKNIRFNSLEDVIKKDVPWIERPGQFDKTLVNLKKTYESLNRQPTTQELTEFAPKGTTDLMKYYQDNPDKYEQVQDLIFLDAYAKTEDSKLSPSTSYHPNIEGFDNTMDNNINLGIKGDIELQDYSGNSMQLKDAYGDKIKNRKFLIKNNGDLDLVVEGNPYKLNLFDEDGNGLGVADNRLEKVLKFQKGLYNDLWKTTDEDIFNSSQTLGIPIPISGFDTRMRGIPVYHYVRGQVGQPNTLMVTWLDPSNGKPHRYKNQDMSYPVNFNEVTRNTAETIGYMNSK
jgi:hypothetical protein